MNGRPTRKYTQGGARWLGLLSVLWLTGCAVGPDYRPPKTALPAQWSEPLAGGATNRSVALIEWWKSFHDPELDSLVERAVRANPDLRLAEARVREARALRGGALANFLPTIDGQGSYTKQHLSRNAQTQSGVKLDTDMYQLGFDASWEIDLFGGQRRQLEQANALSSSIIEDRRDVLVSLLAELAQNYLGVRALQRRLEIARGNIQSQQEALEITRLRFQAGLTSELDVTQARAVLAATRSQLPALETQLAQTMHRLAVLLGQEPGALRAELSPPAPIPAAPPAVPVGLPADLLRRRPDVRRSERELAAATAAIGVQVAELFPKFNLLGTGGLESLHTSDLFTGGSRFWTAGPTVTWRLLEWPRIRAQVRAQNARQEQALAQYDKTVLTALADVEDALVGYAKEQERYQVLRENVAANRRARELANDLYTKGLGEFLNVLDAERSVYQSEDQLIQSEQTVVTNLVALYKALGGGWEQPAAAAANPKSEARNSKQ